MDEQGYIYNKVGNNPPQKNPLYQRPNVRNRKWRELTPVPVLSITGMYGSLLSHQSDEVFIMW